MTIHSVQVRPSPTGRLRRVAGFTLIELMITVAIVAILAAVAYPAYTNAVLKGRRAEGRAALTALMQQQERYFSQNGTYLAFNGPSDSASNTASLKSRSGDGQTNAAYTMGAAQCPGGTTTLATCVLVFAVPVIADSTCGTLTIQSVGLSRGYYTAFSSSGTGSTTAVSGTIGSSSTCWN
jgi:type IV pilus assembly protein PilE